MEVLLRYGARVDLVNGDGETSLTRAAGVGAADAVAVLLKRNATGAHLERNARGCSAVFAAAAGNRLACLELLLGEDGGGLSPDDPNAAGETPIMATARHESHLPCAKV